MEQTHIVGEPPILYFGTPVVLLSSTNEDRTTNLAPISSVFWLGWRCIMGISSASKTAQNMLRTRECVINLPEVSNVSAVNRLAKTTGREDVPLYKVSRGYRYVSNKFAQAGLTPVDSLTVRPQRIAECPVNMEAVIMNYHELAEEDEVRRGSILTFEARVTRTHLHPKILMNGNPDKVDPNKWRPLIMSFQEFYGLKSKTAGGSTLAEIAESSYVSDDMLRARSVPTLTCCSSA